jgi:hypothetical protein
MRNECLYNCTVMYTSVERIKNEQNNQLRLTYMVNISVILLTLLSTILQMGNFQHIRKGKFVYLTEQEAEEVKKFFSNMNM